MSSETYDLWHVGESTGFLMLLTWGFRDWYQSLELSDFADIAIKVFYMIMAMPIAAPPIFFVIVKNMILLAFNLAIWVTPWFLNGEMPEEE